MSIYHVANINQVFILTNLNMILITFMKQPSLRKKKLEPINLSFISHRILIYSIDFKFLRISDYFHSSRTYLKECLKVLYLIIFLAESIFHLSLLSIMLNYFPIMCKLTVFYLIRNFNRNDHYIWYSY